jgi:hypothetical protein
MLRILYAAFALCLMTAAAGAQDFNQPVRVQERITGPNDRNMPLVRVQTVTTFFVAGPTGEGEEAAKLRERARRAIYEMAAHECDLLRDVLAKECRLEMVNVNLNRQFGQQLEGYTASGNMTFQITLK